MVIFMLSGVVALPLMVEDGSESPLQGNISLKSASINLFSNVTVISDDDTLWNNGNSEYAAIAVDGSGTVHVVWEDSTDGAWGTDYEIMHTKYTPLYGGGGTTPPIPGLEVVFILLGLAAISVLYLIMNQSRPKEVTLYQ